MKHLLPLFCQGAKDSESDMRQNSLYGLGELVLYSGPCLEPQYNQILSDLSIILANESVPQVIDFEFECMGHVRIFLITSLLKNKKYYLVMFK